MSAGTRSADAPEADAASAYRRQRVLVLGASGFIGRWVARRLTESGAELILAVRDRETASRVFERYGVRGRVETSDLADADQALKLLERTQPVITFNLAGYGVDPGEQDDELLVLLNSRLPEAVASYVMTHPVDGWSGQSFIHTGSGIEYGASDGIITETTRADPKTAYAKSKLAGTDSVSRLAREMGSGRCSTARLFTVYGPGEHEGRLLPSIHKAAATGKPIDLTSGTQERDFTYVEDVAEALLRLGCVVVSPAVVNVATGRTASVREFAETAARVLSIAPNLLRFGALPTRPDEMKSTGTDVSLFRDLTGWSAARDIEQGIRCAAEREAELASGAAPVSVAE